MANFPAGAIYIWSGTHATIPTGWERVTALDGLYPKGTADATDPNDTGGAATHTHTSSAHTHTHSAHTHTVSIANSTKVNVVLTGGSDNGAEQDVHSHAGGTSGAVSSPTVQSVAVTYAAFSNDPPYYTVIFIKPTTSQTHFPQNGVYLYDGTDTKTGHRLCDGNNSTPNLVDKYLKGAGTGEDAGTTGGTVTNAHTIAHTHTQSHGHAAFNSGGSSGSNLNKGAGTTLVQMGHVHSVTTPANTTDSATNSAITLSETVEPAFKKLLTVQNQNTGASSYRLGMIGMWVGTLASIPSNYVLCDGTNGTQDLRGKHLKSTATSGDIGGTGGSNTHTHAAHAHTHGNVSHTHSGSITHAGLGWGGTSGATDLSAAGVNTPHAISTSASNYSLATANTAGAESNNEPEYRTVAFIKLNSLSGGGAMLMNFL